MAVIIYGTRHYGRVEEYGGEYAHTRFFHLWFLPLIPTGSSWVVARNGDRFLGHSIRPHLRSIAATYLRVWGAVLALGLIIGGFQHHIALVPVGAGVAALVGWSWSWLTVRGHAARRRSDFNLAAFGMRCEPRRLDAELRADLKRELDARWADASHDRTPNEVAQHGATDAAQAAIAYGLLRLAAVDRGSDARAADAAADRILAAAHDAPARDDGPFRATPGTATGGTSDAALAELVAARTATRATRHAAQGIAAVTAEELAHTARRRSRWQLIGLVILTMSAFGGVALFVQSVRPPVEVTIKQLRSLHAPIGRRVHVTCDRTDGPLWEELTSSGHSESKIAMCVLGDHWLPVKLDGDDAIPAGAVTGTLREVEDRMPWVTQGLRQEAELDATALDVFVDAEGDGEALIGGIVGLAIAAGTPVLWFLWFRARRRRRARARATAAAV